MLLVLLLIVIQFNNVKRSAEYEYHSYESSIMAFSTIDETLSMNYDSNDLYILNNYLLGNRHIVSESSNATLMEIESDILELMVLLGDLRNDVKNESEDKEEIEVKIREIINPHLESFESILGMNRIFWYLGNKRY